MAGKSGSSRFIHIMPKEDPEGTLGDPEASHSCGSAKEDLPQTPPVWDIAFMDEYRGPDRRYYETLYTGEKFASENTEVQPSLGHSPRGFKPQSPWNFNQLEFQAHFRENAIPVSPSTLRHDTPLVSGGPNFSGAIPSNLPLGNTFVRGQTDPVVPENRTITRPPEQLPIGDRALRDTLQSTYDPGACRLQDTLPNVSLYPDWSHPMTSNANAGTFENFDAFYWPDSLLNVNSISDSVAHSHPRPNTCSEAQFTANESLNQSPGATAGQQNQAWGFDPPFSRTSSQTRDSFQAVYPTTAERHEPPNLYVGVLRSPCKRPMANAQKSVDPGNRGFQKPLGLSVGMLILARLRQSHLVKDTTLILLDRARSTAATDDPRHCRGQANLPWLEC